LVKRNAEEDKTVHWKISALGGGKKVELRETPHAVTPFGGVVEFLREALALLPEKQAIRVVRADVVFPTRNYWAFGSSASSWGGLQQRIPRCKTSWPSRLLKRAFWAK
jgi:hypothetical protein